MVLCVQRIFKSAFPFVFNFNKCQSYGLGGTRENGVSTKGQHFPGVKTAGNGGRGEGAGLEEGVPSVQPGGSNTRTHGLPQRTLGVDVPARAS